MNKILIPFTVLIMLFVSLYPICYFLFSPWDRKVDLPEGLNAVTHKVKAHKATLVGWELKAENPKGAVLLLHGYRFDRRQMLNRAKYFQKIGYTAYSFDLPAHGESGGEQVTYGITEAKEIVELFDWVQARHGGKIILDGFSLGAASIVFAIESINPDLLILEGLFTDLERSTLNRIHKYLGPYSSFLLPLTLMPIKYWLNLVPKEIAPVSYIGKIKCPTLIMGGRKDERAMEDETNEIFNLLNVPKQLVFFEEAMHEDFMKNDPTLFRNSVQSFFEKYL